MAACIVRWLTLYTPEYDTLKIAVLNVVEGQILLAILIQQNKVGATKKPPYKLNRTHFSQS